jgi:hypothetical protein
MRIPAPGSAKILAPDRMRVTLPRNHRAGGHFDRKPEDMQQDRDTELAAADTDQTRRRTDFVLVSGRNGRVCRARAD